MFMRKVSQVSVLACTVVMAMTSGAAAQSKDNSLRGSIKIDGSSTVYPITEAVAEEFRTIAPKVRVTVGISGTGGGFKRFTVGETDISDASRPIKGKEFAQTVKNNVEFIEIPVAYDGLSVVVNPKNSWVDSLTIDELKLIFLEDKAARSWHDVRPEWPDKPIKIYAPGTDSGTFDYFKEVVAGKKGSIRSDMSVSEDDNVLVRGVAGDPGAIGFFGVAYYEENTDKLKIVPIVNPDTGKAVTPTSTTIADGEYAPFSRPLFIYVNSKSIRRPEVKRFVDFYIANAAKLAAEVGYVKLPDSVYAKGIKNIKRRKTGTCYLSPEGKKIEGPITELYK